MSNKQQVVWECNYCESRPTYSEKSRFLNHLEKNHVEDLLAEIEKLKGHLSKREERHESLRSELAWLRERVRAQQMAGWRITESLRKLAISAHIAFKSPRVRVDHMDTRLEDLSE